MRDFFKQIEALRRRQERISEAIKALQLVSEHDGKRIQALVQLAEQRLKAMENRRK